MTYCTASQVANLLQIQDFDTTTTPTLAIVDEYISRVNSKIEKRTGHAWRTVTVEDEYITPSTGYLYGTGIRFKLNHRSVKTLQSGVDKLEIWDGNDWLDFVANKTEGRDRDYWLNEKEGVIYISGTYRIFPDGVRISYRYGETSVEPDIEEVAVLMTAIMVLNSPEFTNPVFTDDGSTNRTGDQDKINIWNRTINNTLSINTEFING